MCFHCSAGCAVSHSQLEEWISGSFIQSHWPCMTLWPISMFSRILATPSMAAPATHAGFQRDAKSVTRPATARPRWIVMMPVDVRRVGGAAGLLDLGADRVELAAELLDLLVGEVGVLLDVGDGHGVLLSVVEVAVRRARSDVEGAVADAAVTQVCTCSLGWSYSSPLRRSRTVPVTSVSVQVWQMPIRQP